MMAAEPEPTSRREILSVLGAAVVGVAAAQPASAGRYEPTMTYGQLPVPVYGAFDGKSVGNKYEGIKPAESKTFTYLPWMVPKKSKK